MRSSEATARYHVAIGDGAGTSGSPLAASRLARRPLNELADIAADVMAAVGRAQEDGPQSAAMADEPAIGPELVCHGGHSQLNTTAIYTHVAPEDLRRAVEKAHPRERAYNRRRKKRASWQAQGK